MPDAVYPGSTTSVSLAPNRAAHDIRNMAVIPAELADTLRSLGIRGVYEPVLMLAEARLELAPLLGDLLPVDTSPLSHRVRTTLRYYLPRSRPDRPYLLIDGEILGAEVPLREGAWCVVEDGAITIYVPHGLPHALGDAAVGRRLGAVVSIIDVERFDYVIDASEVALGSTPDQPGFDTLRAPVPTIAL